MAAALKKRRSEELVGHANLCYRHCQFSLGVTDEVVPWDDVIGCETMKHALNTEVLEVVSNPSIYELSSVHGKPVQRFLRFYGVTHSSKTTVVMSFAAANRIDVLFVKSLVGFEPYSHLPQIYKHAKELRRPVLIVLKNIDTALRTHVPHPTNLGEQIPDPLLGTADIQRHTRNINMFANCLNEIQQGAYPAWTILLTDNKRPLPFEIDQFFDMHVYWNGRTDPVEIFTQLERARILAQCIYRFQTADFGMNEKEQLEFVAHGEHTTYNQIERFVRRAASLWKERVAPADRISIFPMDERLNITADDLTLALRRQGHSISPYHAGAANIQPFV